MRVLVTGASGFVGRYLVPRLEASGASVRATDRQELDVCDEAAVARALAACRPEAVVHLAAQSSDARSRSRVDATWRINFGGTLAVLRACARSSPPPRVLLVGSGLAYGGGSPRPRREDDPLAPASPYARTKAAADLLGGVYARRGLSVVRARPFNHTGPGQPDHFAVPSFARQIAEIEAGLRGPVIRVGNLDAVRDLLHVEDVVEAYLRLLDPGVPPRAFNVARGEGVRIGDLLQELIGLAAVRVEVRIDPDRVRPADALVGDPGRLTARTGWRPRRSLRETLEDVLRSWRERVRRR